MFSTSRHRPPGRPRPGAQRHNSKIVIGVGLIVVIVLLVSLSETTVLAVVSTAKVELSRIHPLQANSGFPSNHKSERASERQLADRILKVPDYGGTQQVAIQQGDTTTVIQQDPSSARPRLEVIDNNGVHTASKYKPLDTPGISVTKGGAHNTNTVVHVVEGNAKQSIELLSTATNNASDKPPGVKEAEAAAANSAQGETSVKQAKASVTANAGTGGQASSASSKTRSSFHGGGTTEDSAASSNITERASQDQKQAMAATDRQTSSTTGEISSSASDDAHPKDPARRQADTGLSGALSSAAAAVASGVKSLASNTTQVFGKPFFDGMDDMYAVHVSLLTTCLLRPRPCSPYPFWYQHSGASGLVNAD